MPILEYKDVYVDLKAVSGRMVLKVIPLAEDIVKLGEEGMENRQEYFL